MNYVYEVQVDMYGDGRDDTERATGTASTPEAFSDAGVAHLYTRTRVAQGQTRVLRLFAGGGDDPLACQLETMALDGATDNGSGAYEALSYCWGDATQPVAAIEVGLSASDSGEAAATTPFPIHASLHEALRHLRPAPGEPPRRLWVDAVCINQADLEERAWQVAQMHIIYRRARRVVVWLGAMNELRRRCFAHVEAIQKNLEEQPASAGRGASAGSESEDAEFALHDLTRRDHDAVEKELSAGDSILPFTTDWRRCDFDWFRRTWVLQEVASARDAVVCCGTHTVSWTTLMTLARHINMHKGRGALIRYGIMPTPFVGLATSATRPLYRLTPSVPSSSSSAAPTPSAPILDVLIMAHSLKASDPRDKLFALLQFGRETHAIAALPPAVRPDYRKPVLRVFADFVRWWIGVHRSLRILSAVHTLPGRSWQKMDARGCGTGDRPPPLDLAALDHPSWCVWHGGEANWAKGTLALGGEEEQTANRETAYHAGGPMSDEDVARITAGIEAPFHDGPAPAAGLTDITTDPGVLSVAGHRLCTLREIRAFPFWAMCFQHPQKREHAELYDAFDRIFDPSSDHRTWLLDHENQEAKRHAVPPTSETTGSHADADQHSLSQYLRHITYHRRGFAGPDSNTVSCCSRCYFLADGVATPGAPPTTGHLGLCPHTARPGDIVVMLYGGPVLYLLRERDNRASSGGVPTFTFVGECIVEGHMQGQVLQEAQAKGLAPEVFHLV